MGISTIKSKLKRGLALTQKESGDLWEYIRSLEKQQRWIPVSERLPETDDEVLATDGIDMFVAWYSRQDMWQGWISSDNNFERNTPIEAWMSLPQPYKAESE